MDTGLRASGAKNDLLLLVVVLLFATWTSYICCAYALRMLRNGAPCDSRAGWALVVEPGPPQIKLPRGPAMDESLVFPRWAPDRQLYNVFVHLRGPDLISDV